MKKLLLIIVLIFISCEQSEITEEYECEKTTYYYKDLSTQYIYNIETYIVSTKIVKCIKPEFRVSLGDNLYYNIEFIN